MLELAFASKALRTLCESESGATNKFGKNVAESLKHRLADMRAASSVKDLVVGKPRVIGGSRSKRMAIDLGENHRIVLVANHTRDRLTATNEVDWSRVTRIKIMKIEAVVHGPQTRRVLS